MSVSSSLSGTSSTAPSTTSGSTISNPNQGPITFTGLGSGIDTSTIISELLSVSQQPITQLQNQQTTLDNQQAVYSTLSSNLQSFLSTVTTLSDASAFDAVAATSSNTAAATISSTSGATAGNYNLVVSGLAQAQKISSAPQTDATSALSQSGVIVVNGKALTVSSSDSLTSLASNINGLDAGVTASIINGGAGNAYLTLSSNSTGLANQMQIADYSGSVLKSLGVTNGTDAIRSPITDGAQSYGFSSSSATLDSLLGSAGSGTSSVTINGTAVSINPSTDSLQSIANSINTNVSGVTASVVSSTNEGTTSYQLQLTGTSTPTIVDGGHIFESLGILQQGIASPLVSAQDASYSLDGVNLTSPSNTISTAIPDVTFTLLEGSKTSPQTSTLSLSQDTSSIVSTLQNFVSGYNTVSSYISTNSTFDTSTDVSGALFGDPIANQVQNGLSDMLFQNVPGVTGQYNNLADIGFTVDQSGNLDLNTTDLTNALATNPTAVANLFQAIGTTSTPSLTYVTSSSSTQPTTTGAYAVSITQLATKASLVSSTAQMQNEPTEETLTFNGSLFQNNPYSLNLDIGASLSQTVAQINSDATLKNLVHASINKGALEIDSNSYGSAGNFTVQSNLAAASSNTGIGTSPVSPTTEGLDVEGTINGESATGSGQYLTGNSTNANTAGLELQYTGSTTGEVGTVSFSQGMGGQLSNLLNTYSEANTGLIAGAINASTAQVGVIQTQINSLNAQLTIEQQTLTTQFNDMQTAINTLDSESKSLDAILGTSSTSTSSSSSTL